MSVKVNLVSTFDGRGLGKATKSMQQFGAKAIWLRLKAIGVTSALYKLGKASLQAAADDQKAQAILANNLRNLGWGKATAQVEAYIDATQRATGVADDQLRPAFSRLLGTLNSVTASEELLNRSLDIAAGTGRDLESVVATLTKALAGNRKGLMSLGTGLDANYLKSADMADILDKLQAKYSGAAAAGAATYAGTLDRIKIAATEAGEALGKSFFDALGQSENGVQNLSSAINTMAGWLGSAIGKLGSFFSTTVKGWQNVKRYFFDDPMFRWIANKMGWKAPGVFEGNPNLKLGGAYGPNQTATQSKQTALDKALLSIKNRQAVAEKKISDDKARQLRLTKLSAKFNLELAGIAAARARVTDQGLLNRLSVLDVIARDNAGLPVSAAELAKAEKAGMNITVNVQGSVVTERDLVDSISSAIRAGGGGSRYAAVAM